MDFFVHLQFFILCFSPAFSPFQHSELPVAPLSLCFDVPLVVYGEGLLPQMLHIESWRFLSHAAQTLKRTYTHNEISVRLLKKHQALSIIFTQANCLLRCCSITWGFPISVQWSFLPHWRTGQAAAAAVAPADSWRPFHPSVGAGEHSASLPPHTAEPYWTDHPERELEC